MNKMTDLTEKWKKGELESGYYFFKTKDNIKIGFLYEGLKYPYDRRHSTIDDVIEVLAPVPTYQEYLESEAHCAVYSEENKRLKEDVERYASECAKLQKQGAGTREQLEYKKVEYQQLRQLLKDVRKLWKGTVFMPDNQEQVRDVLSRIDAAIDDNKIQATSIANIKIQESEE